MLRMQACAHLTLTLRGHNPTLATATFSDICMNAANTGMDAL